MSEGLYVPEENLEEVIKVIKAGLKAVKVSRSAKTNLTEWCNEMEEYLADAKLEDELQDELDEEEEELERPKKKK